MRGGGEKGWGEKQFDGEICNYGRVRRRRGGRFGGGSGEVLIWDVTVTISVEALLAAISIFPFPFSFFFVVLDTRYLPYIIMSSVPSTSASLNGRNGHPEPQNASGSETYEVDSASPTSAHPVNGLIP